MADTIEIKHLSREEKLRVMEAIWDDLSREEELVESPDWHREALEEADRRLKSGQESIVDWNEAKKELRKRFE
jgi:hypothetical protein